MFYVESKAQVRELIQASIDTGTCPCLMVPEGMRMALPLSWSQCFLTMITPHLNHIQVVFEFIQHYGSLMAIQDTHPQLHWSRITSLGETMPGLFLWDRLSKD